MCKRLLGTAVAILATVSIGPAQVVLYDRIGEVFDASGPCWDGGIAFLSENYGEQVGQRVSNPGNLVISRVSGDFTTSTFERPDGALIQVFALDGDTVGALLSEIVDAEISVEPFSDRLRIHSSLGLGLVADNGGGDVLVVMQPHSVHTGAICWSASATEQAFVRDFSSFGYAGRYGFTDWRTPMHAGLTASYTHMRVEAVPEPSSALALAGLSWLYWRRRRS